MHPSHFYASSTQSWEKCLVKVSFKSAHFASFGRALKKCVKITYFCTPEDCYGKFITCLVSIAKKKRMHVLLTCCFNRHSNLQYRMNCGSDGAELHHTTLLKCLGGVTAASTSGTASSAASWHCREVVASLARPIGLFPSGYVKAKAYTCPWATNSYRIQDCYRQGITEISTDQCRRTVDHYRHFRFLSFLHISFKSHQSW